jgi:hypothetical protein
MNWRTSRVLLEANNCVLPGLQSLTRTARDGNPHQHLFGNILKAQGLLTMMTEGESAGSEN